MMREAAPICPRGTHDFGTGGALRCTKCKRTMADCYVEQGRQIRNVTEREALASLKPGDLTVTADPYAMPTPNRPGVTPIEPPSSTFRRFAQERHDESQAAADAHNATMNHLIALGMTLNGAGRAMELVRSGVDPAAAFLQAMREHNPHALEYQPPRPITVMAPEPEPEQELLDAPEWNRADEVAKPYGLQRRHGEDDDSLHTRVRAHVASRPGLFIAPPPMDWTPPKKPKAIPTARRGPIIDVD